MISYIWLSTLVRLLKSGNLILEGGLIADRGLFRQKKNKQSAQQ